jgi:UDP-glucose 4-epimerase
MLIAECERIKSKLGWQPRYDDLDVIAESSLKWEQHLAQHPAD